MHLLGPKSYAVTLVMYFIITDDLRFVTSSRRRRVNIRKPAKLRDESGSGKNFV